MLLITPVENSSNSLPFLFSLFSCLANLFLPQSLLAVFSPRAGKDFLTVTTMCFVFCFIKWSVWHDNLWGFKQFWKGVVLGMRFLTSVWGKYDNLLKQSITSVTTEQYRCWILPPLHTGVLRTILYFCKYRTKLQRFTQKDSCPFYYSFTLAWQYEGNLQNLSGNLSKKTV